MVTFFKNKWRWFAGLFGGLALAVGVYALVGFYLVPYLVQTQVWPRVSEKMGGQFHAEKTAFDPFKLAVAIDGFSLKAPDNGEVASIGELKLDIDAMRSIKSKSLVADVKIIRPSINVLFDHEGKPNFEFLLSKPDQPKEEESSSGAFPFLLTLFDVKDGRLSFEDQSRGLGFKKVLSPLNFTLANLGTNSASAASFKLNAEEEGKEFISSDGDLHFEETSVSGEFQLQDLNLAPLAAWLVSEKGYVVLDGLLSLKLQYKYGKESDFEIPLLEAQIKGLNIAKDGQPFLTVDSIATQELSFQQKSNLLHLKKLGVENISLKGAAAVDVAAVNAEGLEFDVKASQLKLDSIGVEKIGVKSPSTADIASIKLQGIGFDVKTNQLKLASVGVEKIGAKTPTPVDVASISLQGLGFDVKANQLKLESIGVDKIGLKVPANPVDIASLKALGLDFDVKANQLKLASFGIEKIGVKAPVPVDVGSANAQGLGLDLNVLKMQLKTFNVEKVDLKSPTPIREDNGKPRFASVGSIKLDGIDLSAVDRSVHLGKITTQKSVLAAWREQNGSIGAPGMPPPANPAVKPSPTPAKPASKEPPSKPWTFGADVIELNNNDIALRDFSVTPPVAMRFSPLNLLLKNFSTVQGKPFWIGMNTGLTMNGRIALEGNVNLSPAKAIIKIYVDDLSLPGLQAYFDNLVRFNVVKGALNLNADIEYNESQNQQLRFTGDVAVANFASDDKREGKDFINLKKLRLNGIVFETNPQRISIREIITTEPYIRAILDADKKFNIAENLSPPASKTTLATPKPETPPAEPVKVVTPVKSVEAKKSGKPSKVEKLAKTTVEPTAKPTPSSKANASTAIVIGTVHIHKANADFTDMTIKPTNFSVNIHDLTGDIRGLTSSQEAKSDVMLEGKLNEGSPVKIYGKINLFSVKIFTDIIMNFTDVNLTTLSPYSGKFAGFRIEKGKLSMDLHYKLSNGQLTAENKFILDNLTLGEQVESADATSLPVKLAISLLKDSNGRIDLNLPVTGDLSNPQIDIWSLLGNAATTLLTKLVTAPFNLIGGLVSGGGTQEDLGSVSFQPGKTDLSNEQKGKLDEVAKALKERPALSLEIKGTAHQTLDRSILAEQDLTRQLKNNKLIELGKTKSKPSDSDELTLSQEDYARLLTNLIRSKIPNTPELQDVGNNEALSGEKLASAKSKLLEQWVVSEGDLRSLAQTRGKSIREYLVQGVGLPDQRIYLLDVKLLGQDDKEIKALLSLNGS